METSASAAISYIFILKCLDASYHDCGGIKIILLKIFVAFLEKPWYYSKILKALSILNRENVT
jgi:hypothetical protein